MQRCSRKWNKQLLSIGCRLLRSAPQIFLLQIALLTRVCMYVYVCVCVCSFGCHVNNNKREKRQETELAEQVFHTLYETCRAQIQSCSVYAHLSSHHSNIIGQFGSLSLLSFETTTPPPPPSSSFSAPRKPAGSICTLFCCVCRKYEFSHSYRSLIHNIRVSRAFCCRECCYTWIVHTRSGYVHIAFAARRNFMLCTAADINNFIAFLVFVWLW